jgi:DNA-directed RNA polymerase specialized sigma subunit
MTKNPLEALEEAEEKTANDRKAKELDMLHTWRANGQQPEHLQPLIQAYNPVVNQKIKQWKAPSVPESAFRAELHGHLIKAFETYDPNRGAQLSTHVENRLRKAMRYNANYQNVARIPEGQIRKIAPIRLAQQELKDSLGRDPTHDEIADHLGMAPKQVARVMGSLRADIPDSAFESQPDDTMKQMGRDREVLSLLPTTLSHEERTVFHHIFGTEGHQKIDSTNDLAKKLGKSPSQISRIKTSILKKYEEYK